jgi:hypothetical protein
MPRTARKQKGIHSRASTHDQQMPNSRARDHALHPTQPPTAEEASVSRARGTVTTQSRWRRFGGLGRL